MYSGINSKFCSLVLVLTSSGFVPFSFGCVSELGHQPNPLPAFGSTVTTVDGDSHDDTKTTQPTATNPTQQVKRLERRKIIVELKNSNDLNRLIEQAPASVLIDFYADWCPPCRRQSVILHEMENSLADSNATVIKVNVDQHPELASQLQVTSLPTLMVVKNGKLVDRQSGMASAERVAEWMAKGSITHR